MAQVHLKLFGLIVEFDHNEVNQISSGMNQGAAGAMGLATMLAAMGISGSATVISNITSAALWLGASHLQGCDANQRGIHLYVVWPCVPFCKSR
jgi:hypothetical protein